MIVYTNSFGRLGNQLWTHAHLLAIALDRDVAFLSTTLRSHDGWRDGNGSSVQPSAKRLTLRPPGWAYLSATLAYRADLRLRFATIVGLMDGELLDMEESAAFGEMVQRDPLVFVSGLFLMAPRTLERHADTVKTLLMPDVSVTHSVDERMAAHRARARNHVAVHLRRGDYRTFCDGLMFYTDTEYGEAMRAIADQMRGSTLFHLFSDEPVDPGRFAPLQVEVWRGSAASDLHAMGGCDLILGPNSSYSQWASFAGNRPLHVLSWRAEEHHGSGPQVREPDVARDFAVFPPAGFGRFATHSVELATVVARHGRWN